MENNISEITHRINTQILAHIGQAGASKNAIAKRAGIPLTTFSRKINGHGDFTIRELGMIAEALEATLADIIPREIIERAA